MMDRVEAEQDLRLLRVMVAATYTQEGLKEAVEELEKTAGEVFTWGEPTQLQQKKAEGEEGLDPEFNRTRLRALKARHGV